MTLCTEPAARAGKMVASVRDALTLVPAVAAGTAAAGGGVARTSFELALMAVRAYVGASRSIVRLRWVSTASSDAIETLNSDSGFSVSKSTVIAIPLPQMPDERAS